MYNISIPNETNIEESRSLRSLAHSSESKNNKSSSDDNKIKHKIYNYTCWFGFCRDIDIYFRGSKPLIEAILCITIIANSSKSLQTNISKASIIILIDLQKGSQPYINSLYYSEFQSLILNNSSNFLKLNTFNKEV